ncbi:MAG: tape measure protein [Methylomicrobium sp.]|nr:tape measure protein [Methylomicrobium sp.]
MSLGKISIELELKDGKFEARAKKTGAVIRGMEAGFAQLDKRVKGVERSVGGFLPKIRDLSIVTAATHSIIHTINGTMIAWTGSVIKANAEIERMSVLLQGLSSDLNTEGRIKEAADEMSHLFDMAQKAPFSIKELSNSFVKMKSAGLEDVDKKLVSITDAIARFGGNDDILHRATIAIQQMASKGVISMEELRQQLGEAVPNAMNLMADGLGLPMQKMVDLISQGRVKAVPAIDAMMEEMNRTMSGSAVRMMDTWNGMMSQFETKWVLLQKQIGDAGFFDSMKDGLKDILDFMDSDGALKTAKMIGDVMHDTIELTKTGIGLLREYGDILIGAIKTIAVFWAAHKVATGGVAIYKGLTSSLGSYVAGITATTAATKSKTVVLDSYMGIATKTGTEVTKVAGATRLMGGAMAALGGPVGIAVAALTALPFVIDLFTEKVNKSLDAVKKYGRELNDLGKIKPKLFDKKSIDEAANGLRFLREEAERTKAKLKQMEVDNVRLHPIVRGPDFDKNLVETRQKMAAITEEIKNAQVNIEDSMNALIERGVKRRLSTMENERDESIATFGQSYKQMVDLARKARDAIIAAGGDEEKANAEFNEAKTKAAEKLFASRIDVLKNYVSQYETQMAQLADKSEDIAVIRDVDIKIKINEESLANLQQDYLALKVAIEKATTPDEKRGLEKQLSDVAREIENTSSALENMRRLRDGIIGNPISTDDIIAYSSIIKSISDVNGKLVDMDSALAKLRSGEPVSIDAIINTDSGKQATALMADAKSALKKESQTLLNLKRENAVLLKEMEGSEDGKHVAALKARFEITEKLYKEHGETTIEEMRKIGLAEAEHVDSQLSLNKKLKELAALDRKRVEEEFRARKALNPREAKEIDNSGAIRERERLQLKLNSLRDEIGKVSTQSTAENTDALAAIQERVAETEKELLANDRVIDKIDELNDAYQKAANARADAADRKKAEADAERTRIANERLSEQAMKQAERREKWLADQKNSILQETNRLTRENLQDGTEAYRQAVDDRIQQFQRQAEAQARLTGLGRKGKEEEFDTFVKQAVAELEEKESNRRIQEDKARHTEIIRGLNDEIYTSRLELIEDSFDRERQLLERRFEVMRQDAEREIALGEDKAERLRKIEELRQLEVQKLSQSQRTEFGKMMAETQRFEDLMSDVGMSFVNGWTDGFARLAFASEASFKDMAAAIIKQIGILIIKYYALAAAKMIAGVLGAGAGAGGIVAGGGNVAGQLSANFAQGGVMPIRKFANGGVMDEKTARLLAKAPVMSRVDMLAGGVKNSPQVALFAEADVPEAFIPMPDGAIPLSMSRNKDGSITGSIPLPSGQILPTKIIEDRGVKAFAAGGAVGRVRPSSVSSLSAPNIDIDAIVGQLMRIESAIDRLGVASVPAVPNSVIGGDLAHTRNSNGSINPSEISQSIGSVSSAAPEINISVNVASDGKREEGNSDGKDAAGAWTKMAKQIEGVVVGEIVKQKRPGGLLYQGR